MNWTDTRKYITYTTPDGHKCRDNKLHDETYLKENLEKLFEFRQATGFVPLTYEPENGWLGEMQEYNLGQAIGDELLTFGKNVEDMQRHCSVPKAVVWTDAKQKQRENLKKLALGQKISVEQNQEY